MAKTTDIENLLAKDGIQFDGSQPLAAQIRERIERHIRDGALQAGDRLLSENKLAAVCGVSRMTARAALQQLADANLVQRHVGRGTVVAAPAKVAAQPEQGSKLILAASETFGFTNHHPYYASRMQGILDTCAEFGFRLQLMPLPPGWDRVTMNEAFTVALNAAKYDGMLVFYLTQAFHQQLLNYHSGPCVCFGGDGGSGVTVVGLEPMAAYRAMASHLSELGHQRVGAIAPDGHDVLPLQAALEEHGCSADQVYVYGRTREGAYDAVKRLLDAAERPSAIYVTDDTVMPAARKAIADAGLSVPNDLSLVGLYNNTMPAEPPDYSAIEVNGYQLGRLAANALLAAITEQHRMPPRLNMKLSFQPGVTTGPAANALVPSA